MVDKFTIYDLTFSLKNSVAATAPLKSGKIRFFSYLFLLRTFVNFKVRFHKLFRTTQDTQNIGIFNLDSQVSAASDLSRNKLKNWRKVNLDQVTFGPWTGELGMEILYWAPWVSQFCAEGDLIISRGGTSFLYPEKLNYVDLFATADSQWWSKYQKNQIAVHGGEKQRAWLNSEYQILKRMNLDGLIQNNKNYLHPKEYFRQFYDSSENDDEYLNNYVSQIDTYLPRLLRSRSSYLHLNDLFESKEIERKISFGVYSRQGVGDTEIRQFMCHPIVENLLRGSSIMSLRTKYNDIHHSHLGDPQGIHHPLAGSNLANNLIDQAALISQSDALVTTHGGLAYLGLLLGKDVCALQGNINAWHPRHKRNADLLASIRGVKFQIITC